jgi:hypothetical protein
MDNTELLNWQPNIFIRKADLQVFVMELDCTDSSVNSDNIPDRDEICLWRTGDGDGNPGMPAKRKDSEEACDTASAVAIV